MNYKNVCKSLVPAVLLLGAGTVQAHSYYVSGAWAYSDPDNVSTSGRFTDTFTTGEVTGVSPPLSLPSGTPVGWDTRLDNGNLWSIAVGWQFHDNFRVELEYNTTQWDVDTHRGVSAGGIDLTAVDAGVLISGNVGDLGVSTGDLVADGRGSIKHDTFFLNGYYDFRNHTAFTPYVGVGIGTRKLDVDYRPSGVGVIDDSDRVFVYQLAAGVLYALTEQIQLQAGINYVDGRKATVRSELLPARFDIESQSIDYRLGIKYNF